MNWKQMLVIVVITLVGGAIGGIGVAATTTPKAKCTSLPHPSVNYREALNVR